MSVPFHGGLAGRRSLPCAFILAAVLAAIPAHAQSVADPTGDFLSTYTGPHNGDLDVTRIQATYDGATFRLDATTAAPIGTTSTGIYVWGFNRGKGTAGFAAIGATNVLFDSVVIVSPGAHTVTVRDIVTGAATVLPASAITINGNQISVVMPANLLSPQGLEQAKFLVNLWPRGSNGGNETISDFAPDNADARLVLAFPLPVEASIETEQVIDDASDRFDRVQNRLASQRINPGPKLGGFLTGGARFGNRGLGDSLARDPFSRTLEGGIDYAIGSSAVLGVGFAANRSTANLSNGGSLRANIYSPSVYGGWRAGALHVDGYAAYSIVRYRSNRILPIGGNLLTATASPDGHAYTLGGAAGYDIKFGHLTLTPVADAVYTRAHVNGYTEANSLDFGSTLAARDRDSIRLGLGGEVRYDEQQAWGSYSIHTRARAIQELGDKYDLLNFAFTAQNDVPLTVRGPNTGTTYAAVDIGADITTRGKFHMGVSYAPRIDKHGFVDHAASFTISKSF